MAVYDLELYDFDPQTLLGTSTGTTVTYTGGSPTGTATVTDNNGTLTDDNAGGANTEYATADVTIGGVSSYGANVDAEAVWTVTDLSTGDTFQIVQFQVESGNATGYYTLSEYPLLDGHQYQVTYYNSNPGSSTASGTSESFTYADYTATADLSDGIVSGTAGNDTIDASYSDSDGDAVDSESYSSGTLHWDDLADGQNYLNGSGTLSDAGVTMTFSVTDDGAGVEAYDPTGTAYDSTVYVDTAAGETFDPGSAFFLFGDNDANNDGIVDQGADAMTMVMDFAATDSASGVSDEVYNVSFRINDIDVATGGFVDVITITAYDADGNPVEILLSSDGTMLIEGNTVTGTETGLAASDANGSLLVEIPGPVSRIEIDYNNEGVNTQGIWFSDVEFDALTTDYDDTVAAGDGDDTIASGLGDDLVYAGTGNDTVDAGAGNDTVYGEDGNDTLDGGIGDDLLDGGAGDDLFIGGAGADTMYGGTGQDNVDYSASGAAVTVDLSNGTFSGGDATGDSGSGLDGVIGSDYDDTLIGFDGMSTDGANAYTNEFWGGAGNDYIDGAGGDDFLYGGTGDDTILGGAGADYIEGGDGADVIDGGDGADTIYGGNGNDTISGGAGADYIEGGAGDDTIYAGGGDTIYGGDGNDTFIIDPSQLDGNAINIIGDETGDATGDVLDLSLLGSNFIPGSIIYDENDPESGALTLADGTVITFSNIENVICFGAGTRIATPHGARRVEDLKPGDLVLTMDNGVQPLRWIGARSVPAQGRFAPIEIRAGALGNEADLIVSPQHRMLLQGWRSELAFNTSEVFAAAKHLLNGHSIRQKVGGIVTYYHLMFDRHEVIFAEGAATESFHVSDHSLSGVADQAREELFALFPDLRALPAGHGDTARKCLRAHEARLLVA
ncbi:Hint domain-containing protein [Celeribacter neptunius]|uniref:Ca2+-binding protein, RTX toxin-related n=1 Tax=Celeribacter neptunius TaxID=588602 RepID=A0A1I3P320_9RHOB|nr:Hint domain-containing protein [Celeribacter neptunius]SFJ15727.1 Ca2+-binding protein, RTX toxin-related [Celeribacter neptunius]